ncbi:MAG: DUF3465 domain-containing protein [Gammaproteobacteria bacterium]|nr:DUF3465 domain-containing protein [Gammaproteobacteria bacterium]MBT8110320.1 DUF3465 domain-containing protein [Gammaproteobacteria bacterium]NND47667.1 DUF3465 domain-containing protein [Woeseiaceae bacterium]NNL45023.1 DUF3465 domain-containing protein [Woeseiaceae bacterium]
MLKKVLIAITALVGAYFAVEQSAPVFQRSPGAQSGNAELIRAIDERRTAYQVQGSGTVIRVLSDDNDGSRHQRFILELESEQTLLIVHNIDLAPRIDNLDPGDTVSFYGEYEWNDRGGLIHWTHHDPGGQHIDGWIEHNGKRYK